MQSEVGTKYCFELRKCWAFMLWVWNCKSCTTPATFPTKAPCKKQKNHRWASAGVQGKCYDNLWHFLSRLFFLSSRLGFCRASSSGRNVSKVLCYDLQNQCRIAIKIIRDVKRYMENAKIEALVSHVCVRVCPKTLLRLFLPESCLFIISKHPVLTLYAQGKI